MEFITSSKEGRKLVIEGYIYCKNKSLTMEVAVGSAKKGEVKMDVTLEQR